MLPDGSGMELFADAKALPNAELVLITGHASLDTSIQAFSPRRGRLSGQADEPEAAQGVLARDPPSAMKAWPATWSRGWSRRATSAPSGHRRRCATSTSRSAAAGTAVSVFVTGETAAARRSCLHRARPELAPRRLFLVVNCGAISPHLIESEIFGHEKGSFTGADRQHLGFFERTNGGTLFLDEVTEMPLDLR